MFPIAIVYEYIRTGIYNIANTQLIFNTRFRHRVQSVLGSTYTRLLRPIIGVEFYAVIWRVHWCQILQTYLFLR